MKLLYAIALFVMLLMSNNTFADTLKDAKAIRTFSDSMMAKVANGDVDGAFSSMKPYVGLSGIEVDSAAVQSKVRIEKYGQRYGNSVGFEFIDEKAVGNSLIRLRYIEKTTKHALAWMFYFFKTDKGWTLNRFRMYEDFDMLF